MVADERRARARFFGSRANKTAGLGGGGSTINRPFSMVVAPAEVI